MISLATIRLNNEQGAYGHIGQPHIEALIEAVEKVKQISDSGDCGRMLEDALAPFDFGKQS